MSNDNRIPGGFIVKARCIEHSKISSAPPCTRETWNWLLLNANYQDKQTKGYLVKRGQLFRRYKDIRDGLSWHVGFRKERYSESQMKASMKYLTNELMIATTKHRLGVMITICNYDKYQQIKNYEQTNEQTNDISTKPPIQTPNMSDKKQETKEIKKEEINPQPERSGNRSVVPKKTKKTSSKHYSNQKGIDTYLKQINLSCGILQDREPGRNLKPFNAHQWVQKQVNEKKHPGAIDECLRSLINGWNGVRGPYIGYVTPIMQKINGNYYEADNRLTADNYKQTISSMSDVVKNLGIKLEDIGNG